MKNTGMKSPNYVIALDFDGTLVDRAFPEIGPPIPGAFECLRHLQSTYLSTFLGLILYTSRENNSFGGQFRHYLDEAVAYCGNQAVSFWGINERPDLTAISGVKRKPMADLIVDDKAYGVPLTREVGFAHPHVDWGQVRPGIERIVQDRYLSYRGSRVKIKPLL